MDITLQIINLLIIELSIRAFLFQKHFEQFFRRLRFIKRANPRVASTGVRKLRREARLVAACLVLDLAVPRQEPQAALDVLLGIRLPQLVGQVVLVVGVAVDVDAFHGDVGELVEATIEGQLVGEGLERGIGRCEGPAETLIVLVVLLIAAAI